MKIAIAQINSTVGDLAGNAEKILEAANQAKRLGADLVVTPELVLSGYPPGDLLLRPDFCIACQDTLADLVKKIDGITLLVGYPHYTENKLFNAAAVIQDGGIIATYYKNTLNHSAFYNESHYFNSGSEPCVFELAGVKFGVAICVDFWQGNVSAYKKYADINFLLVLNASAFQIDKQIERYQVARQRISETGMAVVYVNLVGGQDERVFDGASFVMNDNGVLTHQLDEFTETLGLVEIQNAMPVPGKLAAPRPSIASIYQALCLGVKDYTAKNSFPGALIGLSGGVDSALTLAIAVDALGTDRVRTVMMPSQYTADISLLDAKEMAATLGVKHFECDIQPLYDQFLSCLKDNFQIGANDDDINLTQENLQARIRGVLLMALSNQTGSLVLTTGNKSEMAVGYCTLYGDMAGGFAVLKDISKTLVYELCHYRNTLHKVIPERIIQRPPSAELRPDQTDQDSLPPYEVLDGIIKAFVEQNSSPVEIINKNYDAADVAHVIQLIRKNEYKRRQAPPGIRMTQCDFGTSWHYPITSKYRG